jgi:hypothetical protein
MGLTVEHGTDGLWAVHSRVSGLSVVAVPTIEL